MRGRDGRPTVGDTFPPGRAYKPGAIWVLLNLTFSKLFFLTYETLMGYDKKARLKFQMIFRCPFRMFLLNEVKEKCIYNQDMCLSPQKRPSSGCYPTSSTRTSWWIRRL